MMIAQIRHRSFVSLLLALGLVLSACSPGAETADEAEGPVDEDETRTLQLVATNSIIGDILANIVGDAGEIEVLMPPGADPHQFEASPGQRQAMQEADLVVANGLELEVRLTDVLEAAEEEGATVHYLFEWIHEPLDFDDHDHGHDHGDDDDGHDHGDEDDDGHDHGDNDDHGHDDGDEDDHGHDDEDGHDDEHGHGEWDPHVWFDPVRTVDAVHVLGERLDEIDDSRDDGTWAVAAEAYAQEILAAHEEIEQILAAIPDERRKLLTNHEAFGYLADRYDFEVVGAIIPGGATLAEPTAREFRDLAELIREHDLPAIFAETSSPTRLAESLASEVGRDVEVVVLYSESLGEPGSGAESYLGMLRVNAERIAEALGG
jgi:zinc/manganese transport system substrate-binding protein